MSGTLGGQGNPLYVKMGDSDWAKDSTLSRIFNSLPEKWRKGQTDTVEATNKNTAAQQETAKVQLGLREKFEKLPWQLQGAIKQVLTSGLGPGGSVFGQLGAASAGLSKQLEITAPEWQKTIKTLSFFAAALEVGKLAFDKMFEVDKIFTDIYGSGVRLDGGLQGLITSSSLAGMTLQDFGGLITKNSTTVAALAGRDVPKLIESFQKQTRAGGEFIMSLQENAETFLQTAEIYQQSGITSSLTNDQMVASSRRFIGEITKTSEATGMSRKSLIDFVGSLTKTGSSFLLLSTLSDKARENFVNASAQLAKFGQTGGKLLYDNIQKYVAGGGTFGLLDDSMLKLVATVPGLGNSFRNLAEGFQKDGQMSDEALNDFAKSLVGAPKALRAQLLAAMPEVAGVLGDLIQNAERVAQQEKEREEKILKEERETGVSYAIIKKRYEDQDRQQKEELARRKSVLNEYESSMNKFNNEITRVYTSLAEGFMPVLQAVSFVVKLVADGMLGLNKWITSFLPIAGENSFFKSLLATKSGPDATSGLGGIGSAAALGLGAFGLVKGIQRFRTPRTTPRLGDIEQQGPGLFGRGSSPDKPLYVQTVDAPGGGLGQGAGGAPGLGGATRGGRMGGLLKGAGRLLGKGLLPLSLAIGAFDAFQGFGADPSASFGGKLLNAGSSALSGATFGLLGSSAQDIAARASAQSTAPGGQAAGQLGLLDQIDQMLSNRPDGLNLQYSETGQALRDFSSGYREMISALSLSPAGGLDTARGLLNLVTPQAPAAVAPAYQAANDWQMEVLPIWKSIRDHNEVMVSLLRRIAGDIDSLGTAPVQASGMLPG